SADELKKCLQLANGVNAKADQGTGVMNRLVNSMEVIEEANKKLNELGSIFEEISSKTSVINDIVFKTQLLSFNASIEAARAGQHGRGFSVVAEEIGNLAQMSGKSATEISNLLSSSEEHVKNIISGTDEKIAEGRSVSLEALQSFDDIRRDIGEITGSIGEVTQNSEGQESVIKNTLDTMVDMKETVMEQGIFTRSIGKSATVIKEQSDVLYKTQKKVMKVIFGGEENIGSRQVKKEKVLNLVDKMKNKNAA
ncbi:MAG: methyl-accepting chemotaxis protein, partial [Bdellovibrionota bacterium]|nr:methyl-accepting chemotaxis protein [Bdellovibrionota bacterium]